jgi:uncharacterized Zn-binding protein involved in type VI secretion
MGKPAAKQGDQIMATDIHIVLVPAPPGPPVPTPLPHPFTGMLNGSLSTNVKIAGMPAATVGSTATNQPPHLPTPPGVSFQIPPTNQGTVMMGSTTVMINGRQAARMGDQAQTCADPVPNMGAQVVVTGAPTVMIGG